MMNHRRTLALACVLMALLLPSLALAQGGEMPPHPYTVCEWGLLVIERGSHDVRITDVLPGEDVLTISGRGAGLFEGNVVVQAWDIEGNVLAEVPTTMVAEEVGGEGEWSAELSVPTEPGTFGSIYAFSPSPRDGSPMAEDWLMVTFDGGGLASFVIITQPDEASLHSGDTIALAGRGDVFENNLEFILENETGRDLWLQSATVDEDGTWQTEIRAEVPQPTAGWLVGFSVLPDADFPTAYDYVPLMIGTDWSDFPLVLRVGAEDTILSAEDPCEAADMQMGGDGSKVPITVESVLAQSTRSIPPQVTLLIEGTRPAECDFPLRTELRPAGTDITVEIYQYVAADASCGGEAIPYSARIPLGELGDDGYTFTVNGVPAE